MPGPSYFSLGSRGVEEVLVVLEYLILLKKKECIYVHGIYDFEPRFD